MFAFLVELQKAQNHLSLLRQEYVKLQNKHVELEQKYNLLVVQSGGGEFEKGSFVARLLNSVADLYDKELYRYYNITCSHKRVPLQFYSY